MGVEPTLAKRCKKCNKTIRHYNNTGYCSFCIRAKMQTTKEYKIYRDKYYNIYKLKFGTCKVCKKRFERNIKLKRGGRGTFKRPLNAVTCSRACSKLWVYDRLKLEKEKIRREKNRKKRKKLENLHNCFGTKEYSPISKICRSCNVYEACGKKRRY